MLVNLFSSRQFADGGHDSDAADDPILCHAGKGGANNSCHPSNQDSVHDDGQFSGDHSQERPRARDREGARKSDSSTLPSKDVFLNV